jgi:hypothetical protein
MKYLNLLLCAGILATACSKPVVDNSLGNLDFYKAETAATSTTSQGILSNVRCGGSNLCYSFSHFDIQSPSPRVYNIYAKGYVPTPKDICAQALYRKDTVVRISTPTTGKYILNFHNSMGIYESDTVQVN